MTKIDINKGNNYIIMVKFISSTEIQMEKIINDLDKFVFSSLDILEKHTAYVIISGYLPILFGRPRSTDDIDILIPKMTKVQFKKLHDELVSNNFWFINSESLEDLFDLLSSNESIRIAVNQEVTPNVELKFIKDTKDQETFNKKLTVHISNKKLFISPLELQIAYKETMLKSPKDIEDALHLRELFKGQLDENKIRRYAQKWT